MSRQSHTTEPLTDREQAILRLVADGLSDREIALRLSVALDTVKWYNKRIYVKLDAQNRTQAAARAKSLGLLDSAPASAAESEASSPVSSTVSRNNLPARMTSFVGRRTEIFAVHQALHTSRLLTLTGIGGAGKTRLAVEVARDLLPNFSDGVFFISLAPVSNVDAIIWTIAQQLNFQFSVHRDPLAQLLEHFRPRTQLLVLDNFDHLLTGAQLLIEILQAAPGVKMLVTSRESLGIYGEVIYPVAGMGLPDLQQQASPLRSESEQLFLERARAINPHQQWDADALRHIAHICDMLEGMPLGIELAATWTDTLAPGEIAAEIERSLDILESDRRDLAGSQRSIRAAFDRSWNLLDDGQRSAFRRLSVLRGGFTREAGEAVGDVDLRTLHALVNKSLLRRNPQTDRYEFHELLRHYAERQLEEAGEAAATLRQHGVYFSNFLAEQWPRLQDNRQRSAVRAVEEDIENVRMAWQYWVKAGEAAELIKSCHALWAVHDMRGWYLAGIDLFEQAIRVLRDATTQEAQICLGWLLALQGLFLGAGEDSHGSTTPAPSWMVEYGIYIVTGDGRRGYQRAREGVSILRRHATPEWMMVMPLYSLFVTSCLLNEAEVPRWTAQECLAIATRMGDPWATARAKQIFAIHATMEGDYAQAEGLALEALATCEARGDDWSKSNVCIDALALLAIRQGQIARAREWLHRGLGAAAKIDYACAMQTAYWQLGFTAVLEEDLARAAHYWRKVFEVAEQKLGGTTFLGFSGSSAWARA